LIAFFTVLALIYIVDACTGSLVLAFIVAFLAFSAAVASKSASIANI
jgi:hypothetical protein